MQFLNTLLSIAALGAVASATLDPATSNTKGYLPGSTGCKPSKTSYAIQAAECSHNTRVAGKQTFAVFKIDHKHDGANGYPYGTCMAYTCTAPPGDSLVPNPDYWTFFWGKTKIGSDKGFGTTCIQSPVDSTCGCENSDGEFKYGRSDCV
ncbi:hypothetical protein DSL72_000008 [Monilinia vaccinii-corymbosi]|uniref:Small secreted protein n=1 Tax=Monilinia vaccinii-corymbosi TaxID=61207 RepID=A0A8A3P3F4_9HELO|nr:hypothetical protein DSL72_000008 [Monilinia vaccinii-corymbosi]